MNIDTINSTMQKVGPKDVFGHFLAIIGLYVSVISFGALLFGLINIYFPDVLSYYGRFAQEGLKWPLAVLVVVFPLYVWLTAYLQADLEKNPLKREFKIRKWLLYFTLAATSVVIVIDLVTLVYRFLNGDLTMQFILKVIAVLLIALSVFVYYLWNIKKDTPALKHHAMKWFVYGVLAIAAFSIIWGFAVSGSPFAERMKRFDERRIQDLQSIQSQIVYYWQAKEELPESIDSLRDDIRGFIPPVDPETKELYRYSIKGVMQFELCAVFSSSNQEYPKETSLTIVAPGIPVERYRPVFENWEHDVGEVCFTRTIDPDLYPSLKR